MTMRWYAVQAFSGYEKLVQKGLSERIERSNLQNLFGDILVPVEEVIEMKAGQKTLSERKLYPGYVLVQMEMNDESWHLVKSTPKVTAFIGGSALKPTPINIKKLKLFYSAWTKAKLIQRKNLHSKKVNRFELLTDPLKSFQERSKISITKKASLKYQWLFLAEQRQLSLSLAK